MDPGGIDVALQVVDAHQRQTGGDSQSLGHINAHHQRSGQSGATGNGNRVDVIHPQMSLLKRLFDDGINSLDVLARSHLGENTAILSV